MPVNEMTLRGEPKMRRAGWKAHAQRLMPELRARADDLCQLCGRPIQFDAPARSPLSPSVDHVIPLHVGGQELPPIDELRLVHFGCNARRGNRTRARYRGRAAPTITTVELMPEPVPHRRSRRRAEHEQANPILKNHR